MTVAATPAEERSASAVRATLSVGIVADDLTGGGDCAVQFARSGWQARLALAALSEEGVGPRAATAVVSDSRALAPDAAHARTSTAVAALVAAGVNRLFLKIDSTMRGSVAAQVDGARAAWEREHRNVFTVVCPAYPAMGRTVRDGRVLVHGEPAEKTAAGIDPVTPLGTGDLATLLPGSVRVTLMGGDALAHAAQLSEAAEQTAIVIVDAVGDDDLRMLARALALLGPNVIPVGSAGLALAMADSWGGGARENRDPAWPTAVLDGHVVVLVSSLHDVSRSQFGHMLRNLPSAELRVFSPPLPVLLRAGAIRTWMSDQIAQSPDLPRIIVIVTPTDRSAPPATRRQPAAPVTVAASLAEATAAIFDHEQVDGLVLVGGEGARAALSALGARSILVADAFREGMPIGVIEAGRAAGLTVVTKAGGFGTIDQLTEVLRDLAFTAESDKRAGAAVSLGIIADDLTGAADGLAQFASRGKRSRVLFPAELGKNDASRARGEATAVSTGSRGLDADGAHVATASAVLSLARRGADRIFVKIDSTVRGPVRAQIEGALDGWSSVVPGAFAIVCPAYPAMGRTLTEGVVRVRGVPVQSVEEGRGFASSSLIAMIPGSRRVELTASTPLARADELVAAAAHSSVLIVDATTQHDLEIIAAAVAIIGPRAVPVGAVGLAAAMAACWSGAGARRAQEPALTAQSVTVVVGSPLEVNRAQVRHLLAALETSAPVAPVDVIQGEAFAATSASAPGERDDLAVTTADAVGARPGAALVFLGDESTATVLESLDAHSLRIEGTAREGMCAGRLEGGPADGLLVITKAGGFGTEDAVTRLVEDLLAGENFLKPHPNIGEHK